MNRELRRIVAVAAVLLVGSCVMYEPVVVSPTPRFDQAWSAAAGAMYDQGLAITDQDRAAGVIRGQRGGTTVTAALQTMADGRVQVKFDGADSNLIDRVVDSYNRRMGR